MRGSPESRGLLFRAIGPGLFACAVMAGCSASDDSETSTDPFFDAHWSQTDARRPRDAFVAGDAAGQVMLNPLCGVGTCDPGNEQACILTDDSGLITEDPWAGSGGWQNEGDGLGGTPLGTGGSIDTAGSGGQTAASGAGSPYHAGGSDTAGGVSVVADASIGTGGSGWNGAQDAAWVKDAGASSEDDGANDSGIPTGIADGSGTPPHDACSEASAVSDHSVSDVVDAASHADSGRKVDAGATVDAGARDVSAPDAPKPAPPDDGPPPEASPPMPLACQVRVVSATVVRSCGPAGRGQTNDPCEDSSDCLAGLGCVETNALAGGRKAVCRPFACTPPCAEGTFYDELPLRDHGVTLSDRLVPICNEADGCQLLADTCVAGRACTVVGQGTTTCLPIGTAQRDQSCGGDLRCAPGLVCAKSTNRCLKLCHTGSDECRGGACQGGSQQLPSGFGVCVGDVPDDAAATTRDADAKLVPR